MKVCSFGGADMLPEIEGWRKLEAKFPGHCDKCGKYFEPRTTCFYSQPLKKVRCCSCVVEVRNTEYEAANFIEVWYAEVYDDETETTTTGNIVFRSHFKHELPKGVKLLQHVTTKHNSETTMKALRTEYNAIRIPD
jgi:hypothetical protein